MSNKLRLTFLLTRVANGTAEPQECEELKRLLDEDDSGNNIRTANDFFATHRSDQVYESKTPSEFWQHAVKQILAVDKVAESKTLMPAVHFLKTAWLRYAAAIIILLSIGTYLWFQSSTDKPEIIQTKTVAAKNDVMPGSDRATLTLADGRTVQLDSNANVVLAEKGINNNNNALIAYPPTAKEIVMNTLSTPKGGQYKLRLSDGTMVWLNAASSITYPTAFKDKTREVSITGEAYFEVAKNPGMPFIVHSSNQEIAVLGTSFNVNAYDDEPFSKISLINGSIKVNDQLLQPGEALLNNQVVSTNTDQDIAWRRGAFDFNEMDLAAAFRQLSRWYNVDIVNVSKVPKKKLGGKMGRDLNLSQVLVILSKHGVKTKLEGNKLIILSE